MDARGLGQRGEPSGQLLWRSELRRDLNRLQDASGGGLAYGNGRLFATTGSDSFVALDPATDARIWVQDLDAAGGAAPTGRVIWSTWPRGKAGPVQGTATPAASHGPGRACPHRGRIGGGRDPRWLRTWLFPSVLGRDRGAFKPSAGQVRLVEPTWSESGTGFAAATISDIGGDPVIADGRVYAGNVSGGGLAALDLATVEEYGRFATAR